MHYRYQSDNQINEVRIERQGESYLAVIEGVTYHFQVLEMQPGVVNLLIDGRPTRLYWAAQGGKKWISQDGCAYLLEKPTPYAARRGEAEGSSSVRAPMPAQVRSVEVAPGDPVEKGQTLLLLEAMKMEIRLQAPRSGRVARLLAVAGETVEREQVLVEIED